MKAWTFRYLTASLVSVLIASLPIEVRSQAVAKSSDVKVGVILPLGGDFARYGQIIRETIEGAQHDGLRFVFEDEGCDPGLATRAYKKLSDIDGVQLILGPFCGSPQNVIAPLVARRGQLVLLSSSAPRDLYSLSQGHMLAVQPSIETEATFMAQRVYDAGSRKVVMVFFENVFSRAHEKAFRDTFKGQVLSTLSYTTNDLSQIKSTVLRIKQMEPDALYVPDALPLLNGLVSELHNLGLGNLKIYSVYSAQSDDVLRVVGSRGEGIRYSYPKTNGGEDALRFYPRLAVQMLAKAVSSCGDKADCVRKKLLSENHFDSSGVLEGGMHLKQIHAGAFTEAR